MILLQETWLTHDSLTRVLNWLPPGWVPIFSTPPAAGQQWQGRGLAILIRRDALQHHPARHFRMVGYRETNEFQLLAARFGSLLVASVYMINGVKEGPDYRALCFQLAAIRGACQDRPMIVAGDFNYPDLRDKLTAAMEEELGLTLLLDPGSRPTHEDGAILDFIFHSPCMEATFVRNEPRAAGSDHSLLLASFPLTRAGPPQRIPAERLNDYRIDWRRLRGGTISAEGLARLRAQAAALPDGLDLDALNNRLLDIARAELGTRRVHFSTRKPWMSDRRVRKSLWLLRRARRLYDTSRSALTRSILRRAQHCYRHCRRQAEREAYASTLCRILDGDLRDFYKMLQRRRNKGKTACQIRLHPYLDPRAAAEAWGAQFARAPPPSAAATAQSPPPLKAMAPFAQEITLRILPDDVATCLAQTVPSSTGPDGLDISLVRLCRAELIPKLADAFTLALTNAPAGVKQGLTLLLPKTTHPSADPMEYRPITLLPALTRLFHKVIDYRLRGLLLAADVEPQGPRSRTREQPFSTQAGFIPGRGTHAQATILHMVAQMGKASYAAFLDIQKAFDSLDHWHLLNILRERFRLPAEWLEVLRRLLQDNTTMIMGHEVHIGRGTFQGSPLSPLLCICFLEDLAASLRVYLDEHPDDFSALLPQRHGQHVLLTMLLLYADDITLLASSATALQRLLKVVDE